jgi:hypothetical protein
VVLIYLFLMINDIKYLFIYWLLYIIFGEMLIQVLCLFFFLKSFETGSCFVAQADRKLEILLA